MIHILEAFGIEPGINEAKFMSFFFFLIEV